MDAVQIAIQLASGMPSAAGLTTATGGLLDPLAAALSGALPGPFLEVAAQPGGVTPNPVADVGLDQMMVDFVDNIYDPIMTLTGYVCYLLAAILCVMGLHRLSKHQQEGPRAPTGAGTLMTFATVAILMSVAPALNAMTISLFQHNPDYSAALSYQSGDDDIDRRAQEALEASLLFIKMVGVIAFVRGWLILRSVADQAPNVTMSAGFTHVMGGALAVNIIPLIRAFQATTGLNIIR